MTNTNKIFAFLSYLLLIPGWLIVLVFRRKQPYELQHARQSLVLNLAVFLFLMIWFVLTWLILAIPIIGPLVSWFAFALVLAVYIILFFVWLMGMIRSLSGNQKPLPFVGNLAARFPF